MAFCSGLVAPRLEYTATGDWWITDDAGVDIHPTTKTFTKLDDVKVDSSLVPVRQNDGSDERLSGDMPE